MHKSSSDQHFALDLFADITSYPILNSSHKLKAQESYYRSLTDNTPVIIWNTRPDGVCIYLNKKWYEYTGQLPEEALGFGWLEATHPDDVATAKATFTEANENQKAFQLVYRLRNKQGEYRWHIDSGQPKYDAEDNFEGFIGTVVDIHDRKLAEDAVKESEQRYKSFAEAMPQMAFIANPEGEILYYNQRWYDYVAGLEGTEGWGWKEKPIHHPDDLQPTIARWEHSLQTGEPYEIEYRLRRHDGQYRWHLGRANPIHNQQGEIELWFGTNTDIHLQKETEQAFKNANTNLQQKNLQLEKTSRLHSTLLHIIAHDLKGPIANMKLALEMIIKNTKPERQQQLLENFAQMIDRQEVVTDGLAEIIQTQNLADIQAKEIKLEDTIQDIILAQKNSLDSNAASVQCQTHQLSSIRYVPGFFRSILNNLLTNAIKYRASQREPEIHLQCYRQGEYVVLSLQDNGIGINLDKEKNALFKPFRRFTTQANGTGIGLYLIKSLVEYNGGFIEVESKPDEGTTFRCYLKEY